MPQTPPRGATSASDNSPDAQWFRHPNASKYLAYAGPVPYEDSGHAPAGQMPYDPVPGTSDPFSGGASVDPMDEATALREIYNQARLMTAMPGTLNFSGQGGHSMSNAHLQAGAGLLGQVLRGYSAGEDRESRERVAGNQLAAHLKVARMPYDDPTAYQRMQNELANRVETARKEAADRAFNEMSAYEKETVKQSKKTGSIEKDIALLRFLQSREQTPQNQAMIQATLGGMGIPLGEPQDIRQQMLETEIKTAITGSFDGMPSTVEEGREQGAFAAEMLHQQLRRGDIKTEEEAIDAAKKLDSELIDVEKRLRGMIFMNKLRKATNPPLPTRKSKSSVPPINFWQPEGSSMRLPKGDGSF